MKGFPVCGKAGDKITSGIDAVTAYNQNGRSIKSRGEQIAGFTLVEVNIGFWRRCPLLSRLVRIWRAGKSMCLVRSFSKWSSVAQKTDL